MINPPTWKVQKNKILVKVLRKEKTEKGIIIPETTPIKEQQKGEVIAIGLNIDDLKKGDTVLFTKHAGKVINLGDNAMYVLLDNNYVLAKIEKEVTVYGK